MSAVQAIAVVLIRLWAVGHLISLSFAILQSLGLAVWGDEVYKGAYGYLQVATRVLVLMFWVLILAYSRTVTAWVLPPAKETDHRIRIAPEDLISAGTFLIGVFYLTEYVPDLLRSVQPAAMQYLEGTGAWGPSPVRMIEFAVSIIAVLIALWLILRPNHLVGLFTWLRRAGLPKEASGEDRPQAE